jgi:hypothetical protein
MSNLTGQQIKDTYPGLLNLATATTGITSTYQQVQDGLGNNTNTRISTNGILAPNLPSLNNLKPDLMGPGFTTGVANIVANTQNRVIYQLFYDTGVYSYSAITYNVNALTSTSDVVTMAFYSLQMVPGIGIAPKDLLLSGITLTSNSTGVKTTTLPSTLSFSGTGGGFYVAAFIISNSNVTPTVRYTTGQLTGNNQSFANSIGQYLSIAGTSTNIGNRVQSIVGGQILFTLNNTTSFPASFSTTDITTNLSTTVTNNGWGFALNVI